MPSGFRRPSESPSSDDAEDPFAGLLEHSSVAQALREARASLARPSRPFTPASRSLFEKADYSCGSTRPSSSYSLDQLSFVRDTFASSRGSSSGGSTRTGSGRSGLRSRESLAPSTNDLCAVPELEEPELELPPELRQCADVLTINEDGEEIYATSPASNVALEFDVEDPDFEEMEEYESRAADDLALRMDIPPPHSDEDSAVEEARKNRSSEMKKRLSANARDGKQLRRKNSSSKLSRSASDGKILRRTNGETSLLRMATDELEALEQQSRAMGIIEVEKITPIVERTIALAADLHEGRIGDRDGQAARLLRAVLALMDRKGDSVVLLRLARCTLELLRLSVVLQDVGSQGVGAAYLNVARALFKLSKEATHDALFLQEGLLEPLLLLLSQAPPVETNTELRIFTIGVLKNVSNNEENSKFLAKRGAPLALLNLLRPLGGFSGGKEAQMLVQATALLRNLSSSSKRQLHLIEQGAIATLTTCAGQHMAHQELQVNIARVVGKLSQHEAACKVLEADPSPLQVIAQSLREHSGVPALVLRLTFALGNLTATSDPLRQAFMSDFGGLDLLPMLLEKYWQMDRKLAQANSRVSTPGPSSGVEAAGVVGVPVDTSECESVLVKLIRLAANVSINQSEGMRVATQPRIVDPLLDILGCKRMPQSEELVLSATAAATNLLYYDAPTNLLFSAENKQLLCRLLRPMLLESYNVEALVEAARALGNLSRHRDARQWISELRIDEALAILLAHGDRDLVFYSCGALVNLAADPATGCRLCREVNLRSKLAALLCDAPADDCELLLVAVKVLSNLRLDEEEEPWPPETVQAVQAGVQRAHDTAAAAATAIAIRATAAEAEAGGVPAAVAMPAPEEMLLDLTRRLLDTLPASGQDDVEN